MLDLGLWGSSLAFCTSPRGGELANVIFEAAKQQGICGVIVVPKVSIVIPVYNTERYLEECLDSVINQTLSDIEIILVDDGSTDGSAEICRRFEHTDARIKFFSIQNSGSSTARNVGLEHATGEYVGFVDSDDWVEACMFERLYHKAVEVDADIVSCGHVRHSSGRQVKKTGGWRPGLYPRQKVLQEGFPVLLASEALSTSGPFNIWTKVFRRQLIESFGIRFNEKLLGGQDTVFCKTCMLYCRTLYIFEGGYWYHYRRRTGSRTTSYMPNAWNVYKAANDYWVDVLRDWREYDFSRQIMLHRLAGALMAINYECKPGNANGLIGRYRAVKAIVDEVRTSGLPVGVNTKKLGFRRRIAVGCIRRGWSILLLVLGCLNNLPLWLRRYRD